MGDFLRNSGDRRGYTQMETMGEKPHMSRSLDANLIAHQILQSTDTCGQSGDKTRREAIRVQFERLTFGLAEYERHQVAWLVNFRLSAPIL